MTIYRWFYLLASTVLCAVIVMPSAHADDDRPSDVDERECTPRAIIGGVECVDTDGIRHWETHHPALWPDDEAYLDGRPGTQPVALVTIDETAFYAIARDLLAVDIGDGVIEDRVRFEEAIAGLSAGSDGMLDVQLHPAGTALLQALGRGDLARQGAAPTRAPQAELPGPRVVSYEPETPPPAQSAPSLADLLGQLSTSDDARRLLESASSNPEAIDLLQSARATDPTNPFLSQLLGTVLADTGDSEAAIRALTKAAETTDAPWQDLLQLSSLLGDTPASDDANRALRQGLEQMQSRGIDPESLAGLLPMVTTVLGDNQDLSALLSAIERGDLDTAIQLGMGIAESLPDADALNERWHQVAAENEAAAYDIVADVIRDLDRMALIALTVALSLMLLMVLVGLRIGVTRRLRIADIAVPITLLGVLVAIPYQLNTHAQVAEEVASIPFDDLQGGIQSAEGHQWLVAMAENPDVQQLLSSIFAEPSSSDADGEEFDELQSTPLIRLLADSAYADAEQAQWEMLKRGQMPDVVAALQMVDADTSEFQAPGEMSLAYALLLLVPLLLLAALGVLVGRKAPGVARPVLRAVPGGSSTIPPLGALALCALIAALLTLFGFDTMVQQRAIPELQQHLAIADIERLASTPSRLWAWVTLAVAIAVQIGIGAWDLSR